MNNPVHHRICEILHSRDPSRLLTITKRIVREELEREFGTVDRSVGRQYVDDFVNIHNAHLLTQAKKKNSTVKISSISINGEKFNTFTASKFKILDSMGFMNASLDSLIKLLDETQKPELDAVADRFAEAKGLDTTHVRSVLGGKIAFAYEND